ncbi:MAG: hypothetical protein ACE5KD_03490 [Candidatus Bathyarchaeia archaeon]
MNVKKTAPQVFEEIEQNLVAEKEFIDLERITVKISLNDMTREEKIKEASKPLYLKRYE